MNLPTIGGALSTKMQFAVLHDPQNGPVLGEVSEDGRYIWPMILGAYVISKHDTLADAVKALRGSN